MVKPRVPQRAFSGGILAPGMWARTDIPKWQTGLKDAVNVILRSQGGAANRAGTLLAGGYDTSTVDGPQVLLGFAASADDTYMLEFSDSVMRVIKQGSYILSDAFAAQSITSITSASPARIEMVNSTAAANFTVGRLVYLLDPNGTSALHQSVLEVEAISAEFITFRVVGGDNIDTTTGSWGSIGSGATLQEVYQTVSPYAIEDLPFLQTAQDVDTIFFAHPDYQPRKLVRASDTSWTFSALTFEPEIAAPTGVAAAATVGTGASLYEYVVAAVDAETSEESLPSGSGSAANDLSTAGNYNTITWSAVTGAQVYRVYKKFNGIYGFIGTTEALTFDDENITPDTADNPQIDRDPFAGANDKPSVAAFVEQRLTFAATNNNPQAVEMSASTTPLNFNRALTPGASDALSFRMRAQQLNAVYHVLEADRPVVLTAGAEWYIETQESAPLSPGNFALRPKTRYGSSKLPMPIVVGENVLHVARDGNTVREFSLADFRDTASADLTVLARHLFEGKTITSMAYAQSPDSVVWITFLDGSCMSLTYLAEHEVWGWTRHEFGGTGVKVKQVAVVKEGAFDVPYFVVERTMGYGTVTLTERLDTRQFEDVKDCHFSDCGLKYDGTSTLSLRGFLHLRGEGVTCLADGNVIAGLAVSDEGIVTLDAASAKVSIGLQMTSKLVTLPADLGEVRELGSTLGRFMTADEVSVSVVDTRGIAVGREGAFLNEVKEFTGDDPIPLATKTHVIVIEGDWERDQSLEIEQNYPLPMYVTAIGPSWSIGE